VAGEVAFGSVGATATEIVLVVAGSAAL